MLDIGVFLDDLCIARKQAFRLAHPAEQIRAKDHGLRRLRPGSGLGFNDPIQQANRLQEGVGIPAQVRQKTRFLNSALGLDERAIRVTCGYGCQLLEGLLKDPFPLSGAVGPLPISPGSETNEAYAGEGRFREGGPK